ncbi:hypothetical protein CFP56_029216 [Quercus suber]|uniref:Uncharacterized protein n=1 Tax=Quercus suber TaxID=58331 RepID=A0AAW0MEL6_QUESU
MKKNGFEMEMKKNGFEMEFLLTLPPKLQSMIKCLNEEVICAQAHCGFELRKGDLEDSRACNPGYFEQSKF